jgi:hypothetical protein
MVGRWVSRMGQGAVFASAKASANGLVNVSEHGRMVAPHPIEGGAQGPNDVGRAGLWVGVASSMIRSLRVGWGL